jgi:putative restriction endonuclease
MIYIEMSRDEDHGGGSWGFTNCVWAPTRKKGGPVWPFWSKVSLVKEGDIIIHLRGVSPRAYFLGYSVASGDGFRTTRRPPNPGVWAFAEAFYRADLAGFTEFHEPINLTRLIASRSDQLGKYFDANKKKKNTKANIFLVRQSERLQCLNGAYLQMSMKNFSRLCLAMDRESSTREIRKSLSQ